MSGGDQAVGVITSMLCLTLVGAALLTRSFLARMSADRGYDATNVITATVPFPVAGGYSASKAAVSMLTVQYAKLLPQMRVNAVDPGLTATDFTGNDGHSVTDATGPVVSLATAGAAAPTGTFLGVEGPSEW